MTAREWINQYAEETGDELLVMDEFDEAIVGLVHRFNNTFVLYDRAKLLEILTADMWEHRDEFGYEDHDEAESAAIEHFDFNIIGGWVGEHTPAFIEYPPG